MKLLITGLPKSGKSSTLARLIASEIPRWGFVTAGIFRNRRRVGFRLEAADGSKVLLAQTTRPTGLRVAKYNVELAALEKFIKSLPGFKPADLLYIDEVGEMQLSSADFQHLTLKCISSKNDFIGTVSSVFGHPFIYDISGRDDTLVCHLTPDNRPQLGKCLAAILAQRQLFNDMAPAKQARILDLSRKYLEAEHYDSLYKLYANALSYVKDGLVQVGEGQYTVMGKTARHTVKRINNRLVCDCPLFRGLAPFQQPAECSHIQAVILSSSAEQVTATHYS